jgi:hypothetical protein
MLSKLVLKNSSFVLDESESSNSNIKSTGKSSSSSTIMAALVNNSIMMRKFIVRIDRSCFMFYLEKKFRYLWIPVQVSPELVSGVHFRGRICGGDASLGYLRPHRHGGRMCWHGAMVCMGWN